MFQSESQLRIPPRVLAGPSAAYATHPPALLQILKEPPASEADVICLSRMRWDNFYQRPQYLLGNRARGRRVFFMEEPVFSLRQSEALELSWRDDNLCVVLSRLPAGIGGAEQNRLRRALLNELIVQEHIHQYVLWYFTPAALSFTRHLKPVARVYDRIWNASADAEPETDSPEGEAEMFELADLVLTCSRKMYEKNSSHYRNLRFIPPITDGPTITG